MEPSGFRIASGSCPPFQRREQPSCKPPSRSLVGSRGWRGRCKANRRELCTENYYLISSNQPAQIFVALRLESREAGSLASWDALSDSGPVDGGLSDTARHFPRVFAARESILSAEKRRNNFFSHLQSFLPLLCNNSKLDSPVGSSGQSDCLLLSRNFAEQVSFRFESLGDVN